MSAALPVGSGDQTRCLLGLLRQAITGETGWTPPVASDWRTFAAVCEFHHLAPWVFCRLQKLPPAGAVPPELLEFLRARYYELAARSLRLAKKLLELNNRLQNEGIEVLAYKGPALAMAAYGNLAHRQCSDLDLVVRKDHLEKAVGVLKSWGFQNEPMVCRPQTIPYLCDPKNPRHVALGEEIPFRAPDGTYYVDLHWQLGNGCWRAFSPDIGKMWKRAEKQDLLQGCVSTFCRGDMLLALSYHGTKHRWLRLKWLLDVAELLRRTGMADWSRVEEMVRVRPGAGALASLAILLAQELLGAPVPAEAARILPATNRIAATAGAIRDEILAQGHSSLKDRATLLELEERPLARMKYRATWISQYPGGWLREVFVLVNPKDRRLVSLPPNLGFLYHLIRPARLVVKHGLGTARTVWSMALEAIARHLRTIPER